MTLDLGAVSDPRLLLKNTPPPPYYVSPWSQTVVVLFFHEFIFDVDKDAVAENERDHLLLMLLFLLYHICHHSFLKSCYLKKSFNFCVLSLFSFFNAFQNGQKFDTCLSSSEADVTLFTGGGRSLTSGLERETCRNAETCDRLNEAPQSLCPSIWRKPILLLSWDFDICLQEMLSPLANELQWDEQSCLLIQDPSREADLHTLPCQLILNLTQYFLLCHQQNVSLV